MPVATVEELLELDRALTATFRAHVAVRAEIPIARRIKFPALPSFFTESIVVHAAGKLFPEYAGWSAKRGGRIADVLLDGPPEGQGVLGELMRSEQPGGITSRITVEVKATAVQETLELKKKDVESQILVWLAFGSRYETGAGPINVYILPRPKEIERVQMIAGRVVKLRAFLAVAEESHAFKTREYASLADLIRLTPGVLPTTAT